MNLWQPAREDLRPAMLIALLPFLIALPQLAGWILSDPIYYTAYANRVYDRGLLRGMVAVDPNVGFQTQALGYRAAVEWLQGRVPWWNSYTGVGLPLAAEYQPAAFFPLTLLMLLPRGIVWEQAILEALAGLGTYALLRQLRLGRLAATTGAILFAFNGTFAWINHAPAQPVAFLPWMLLGIERAAASTQSPLPAAWRVLALSMAMSLLAGFPETAYIDGLLALAWAILRGAQLPPPWRIRYAGSIALGGTTGIALAAPQVVAFGHLLLHASVGQHTDYSHVGLDAQAAIPTLVAPYVYGPIHGYGDAWPSLVPMWGAVGGYATLLLITMAVHGAVGRRDSVTWLLVAWILLALGKTFLVEPAVTLWNLVPGIKVAWFARYAQPSWELALVILAMRGLDDIATSRARTQAAWRAAAFAVVVAIAASAAYLAAHWPLIGAQRGLANSAIVSIAWAALTSIAALVLIRRAGWARAPAMLAALLGVEAALLCAVPILSSPGAAKLNEPAIAFLRANLGLQRFYTLGAIKPNYGAYLGIASINYNYLPAPTRWVKWAKRNLDSSADDVSFPEDAQRAAGAPRVRDELRTHLASYEEAGVKYVVTGWNDEPLAGHEGVRLAYADLWVRIYELAHPRPYFETLDASCAVQATDRERAIVECPAATTLVRRELFFPGWNATVNGADAAIAEHGDLFQSVALPAGRSELRFSYAPPFIGWAWLAAGAALLALAIPRRRRRRYADGLASTATD